MSNRVIFPLLGEGGGGGSTAWGQITGTLSNQTDLQEALNAKASSSDIPTATSDLQNDSGFITLSDVPAQVQANWNESDTTSPAYIVGKPSIPAAQVNSDWNASSGVAEILNKPTIPTVNDSTITFEDSEGTEIDSFTLNQSSNKTITIPSGGGGNVWYGSQEQFDAIPQAELDETCTYYISDNIDYSEIANTPFIPTNTSDLNNNSGFTTTKIVERQLSDLVDYMDKKEVWLTKAEYDALALANKLEEGKNYHIEHNVDTLEMVVTFTDQTTATYNVYIQPAN